MMSVEDMVKRVDEIRLQNIKIDERLKQLQYEFPENEQLQEYTGLLEIQDQIAEELEELKGSIYELMLLKDIPDITVGHTTATLTKPTKVRSIKVDDFIEIFPEGTDEYTKCVKETERKGFVKFKDKVEKIVKRRMNKKSGK